MKFILILLIAILPVTDELNWLTNFEKAKQEATSSDKVILLYFSGSDWCSSCMRMKKEYFSHPDFVKFATEKLVLVNADFPRDKANQLDKSQTELNSALAEKYNSKGVFPLTVLMDKNGKVIKTWSGVPKVSTADFINEISKVELSCHASK
jgi:thioredoxin-related protein